MIPRAVGLAGLAVFLTAAFTPLPNALARRLAVRARIEPADAIVVLGSNLEADGSLDAASLRRAIAGIVLERRGWAPLLVFSGVTPAAGSKGPTEPELRAELARTLGVPGDRIVSVLGARTTREEAVRVGAALRARRARRILLVTDSQHLARARPLFEQAGAEVFPAPTGEDAIEATIPSIRLRIALGVLQESLARLYYRVAGYSS